MAAPWEHNQPQLWLAPREGGCSRAALAHLFGPIHLSQPPLAAGVLQVRAGLSPFIPKEGCLPYRIEEEEENERMGVKKPT